jgi:hypothetical protein
VPELSCDRYLPWLFGTVGAKTHRQLSQLRDPDVAAGVMNRAGSIPVLFADGLRKKT